MKRTERSPIYVSLDVDNPKLCGVLWSEKLPQHEILLHLPWISSDVSKDLTNARIKYDVSEQHLVESAGYVLEYYFLHKRH